MDQEEKIRSLTGKFLKDEASKEEARLLYFYLNDQNNKDQLQQLVDEVWEKSTEVPVYDNLESETLFEKIKLSVTSKKVPVKQRFLGQYNYLKYAASVLIAIGIVYGFYANWSGLEEKLFPVTFVEISNELKTEKSILLEDGSVVKLNTGSRLRYPERFSGNERELFLEGEAYFEVVKNKNKPFVVHTARLKTTVLGTTFNIKAYSEDENIKITLATGKVEISSLNSRTNKYNILDSLTPNQQMVFEKASGKLIKTEVDATNALAWMDDLLIFEDTQVKEVLNTLGRKYEVDIVVLNQAIQNCSISVQFDKRSLEDVLNVIAMLVNAEYKIEGKTVTFSGKGCGK